MKTVCSNKGKTAKLIKMAGRSQGYIVCLNQKECHRISGMARQMKIAITFPITFNDFLNKQYCGKGIKSFLIDNVDLLLQQMTEVKIEAITINKF